MKEKNIIDDAIAVVILLGMTLSLFTLISLPRKVQDLEKRIEELEENNKQVHEYILNRIGG